MYERLFRASGSRSGGAVDHRSSGAAFTSMNEGSVTAISTRKADRRLSTTGGHSSPLPRRMNESPLFLRLPPKSGRAAIHQEPALRHPAPPSERTSVYVDRCPIADRPLSTRIRPLGHRPRQVNERPLTRFASQKRTGRLPRKTAFPLPNFERSHRRCIVRAFHVRRFLDPFALDPSLVLRDSGSTMLKAC